MSNLEVWIRDDSKQMKKTRTRPSSRETRKKIERREESGDSKTRENGDGRRRMEWRG